MRLSAALLGMLATVTAIPAALAQNQAQGLAIVTGFFGIMLIFMLIGVLGTAFWLWMLIDCALRKTFKTDTEKIVWIIILVFLHLLGAVVYFFVVKRTHR